MARILIQMSRLHIRRDEVTEGSLLVQTVRLDRDHTVVTLTKEERNLLESRSLDEDSRERQAFHDGPSAH